MNQHEAQTQRLAIFIVRTLPPSVWHDYRTLWMMDLELLDSLAEERLKAVQSMLNDPSPRINEELLNKAFGP